MDDGLRTRLYRAIYGYPALQKYALGVQQPIRIIVKNGKVTLEGVVDNDTDKNIANIQASSVPGAFSVTKQPASWEQIAIALVRRRKNRKNRRQAKVSRDTVRCPEMRNLQQKRLQTADRKSRRSKVNKGREKRRGLVVYGGLKSCRSLARPFSRLR